MLSYPKSSRLPIKWYEVVGIEYDDTDNTYKRLTKNIISHNTNGNKIEKFVKRTLKSTNSDDKIPNVFFGYKLIDVTVDLSTFHNGNMIMAFESRDGCKSQDDHCLGKRDTYLFT